jgi:hypothetical protein
LREAACAAKRDRRTFDAAAATHAIPSLCFAAVRP